MRSMLLAGLLLALPGCGDDAVSPASATAAGGEAAGPRSPDQIAVEDVLGAQLEAVRHADGNGFAAAFEPDVFVFGPFATHSLSGRDAVVAAISELFARFLDGAQGSSVTSQGASYGFDESRSAAWAFDVVAVGSRGTTTTFAVASLLVKEGGAWKVAAQTWATPVADDLALELAAQGQWPASTPLEESIGDGADAIGAHAHAFLSGQETWPHGGRTDALMIGSAPGELSRGDAAIGAQLARARAGGMRLEALGGVLARRVGGGAGGFAAYTANLVVPRGGQEVRLPIRSLEFYVRSGDGYRIVLQHVSLGAPG